MSRRKLPADGIMPASVKKLHCAVYTRKSTDEGLDKEFNTLDAQRDACEAYVSSQRAEGWLLVHDHYDDDGGFSGGTLERPALKRLLADIGQGLIDVIVVYKIDRLSRSLMDFTKLVETMEAHGVTFVSVTQSFNTTTSMGRLTLSILLSFAQFEREVIGERIRDKFAASRARGMWMGARCRSAMPCRIASWWPTRLRRPGSGGCLSSSLRQVRAWRRSGACKQTAWPASQVGRWTGATFTRS